MARARRAQKAYVDNEENVIATLSTAYFHDVSTAQFTLRPFPPSIGRRLVARFYYAYDAATRAQERKRERRRRGSALEILSNLFTNERESK